MGQKAHPLGVRLKAIEKFLLFKKKGLFTTNNLFNFFYKHSFKQKSIVGHRLGQSILIEQVIINFLARISCFTNRIFFTENSTTYYIVVEYYAISKKLSPKQFLKQKFFLEAHLSSRFADKKKLQFFTINLSNHLLTNKKQVMPVFNSNLIKHKNVSSILVDLGLISLFLPNANLFSRVFAHFFKRTSEHQRFLDFTDQLFSFLYNLEISQFQGLRLEIKGRLNGSDRTKVRVISQGSLPLQTLGNIELSYGFCNSVTPYGDCGIRIFFCYKK
jgi:hypothetical protein